MTEKIKGFVDDAKALSEELDAIRAKIEELQGDVHTALVETTDNKEESSLYDIENRLEDIASSVSKSVEDLANISAYE